MRDCARFFIDGAWVDSVAPKTLDVINPATERREGRINIASEADVDLAVRAARKAFEPFSRSARTERIELLQTILEQYRLREADLAAAVTAEMGAPLWLAKAAQVPLGAGHLIAAIEALKNFAFEEPRGSTLLVKEPIGVCGFITPWNWPLSQIVSKVAPALSVGCTMVLKPSEIAPFSALIFAEIMAAAGAPPGVFNLVNGDGPGAGAAIAAHANIDLVSFTGSTRAGIDVARAAAPTIKRVLQELGGKSPFIILADADLELAVSSGTTLMMRNSGQSCNAPSRMLVPHRCMDAAMEIAARTANAFIVGDPEGNAQLGPVASQAQWRKIQRLIEIGLDEGAVLAAGGLGRPKGLDRGYYARPTVFGHVANTMTIARTEIFGPVLSIIGYDSEDEAIEIANDTDYGLAAYVHSGDSARARRIAARLRAGQIILNDAPLDISAPFGGYKQSGNGRERGDRAFDDFLEMKAIIGYGAA